MISKLFSLPLLEIQSLAGLIDNETRIDASEIPYHRIYSAHDTQIANVMTQIAPEFDYAYVPFSSNVYLELHSNVEDKSDFYVRTLYNGQVV